MLRPDPGCGRGELRQGHAGREVEAGGRRAAGRRMEARREPDAGSGGGHGGRGEALRRETPWELEKRNEPK